MPLIMGILAQAAAAPGPTPGAGGPYDLLQTEILTGDQASLDFTSLNATYGADYQHLQIRLVGRSARVSTNTIMRANFNSDTSAGSHSAHSLNGDGSSVYSQANANSTSMLIGQLASASTAANAFSAFVIDILDPFDTTKNTTVRCFGGHLTIFGLASGVYLNTAAITDFSIYPAGFDWVTGTRISLYGLKAA